MMICAMFLSGIGKSVVCAEEKTGEICIQYHGRTDHAENIPLEGAVFELFFAGEEAGDGWKLSGGFEKSEISLADATASGRREQAEKLYQYAKEQGMAGSEQKTDQDGSTIFSGLKRGLYLVAQKEKVTEKTYGSFYAAPFLIGIPGEKDSDQIIVRPKSEWEPPEGSGGQPPEKPGDQNQDPAPDGSENPAKPGIQTGDAVRMLGLAAACVLAFIVMLLTVRRNRQEEPCPEAEELMENTERKEQMQTDESREAKSGNETEKTDQN